MMLTTMDEATKEWGIKVERVEVRDVRLPQQLQRSMAAEAEVSRQAKSKVIEDQKEKQASRALRDASDVISSPPAKKRKKTKEEETSASRLGFRKSHRLGENCWVFKCR